MNGLNIHYGLLNISNIASMNRKPLLLLVIMILCLVSSSLAAVKPGISFYKQKPDDPDAVYFNPESFNITSDGKTDVSEALQGAINKLKLEQNFGIIFIPEGTYTISRTIYIPEAIRLIGYGNKRPVFVLRKNSPGYQAPDRKSVV